ncbi:hypothetical protein GCM10010168_53320 [Actinoplanes ianthinogenes]|uniref:Head-to-tail adaptor n=1 Tax=Actinoplanes ianthinogenes TaxID=122358 RepID=A0ABN6C8A6_9ACTN|nr:hypothetical protein [Actinoplanes ianthinogenes]BCJ41670.1 hypothetical protein Aiant_23270 [Actinoplanes ianthinogenes]GGR28527.1 hypothetical protein GCM10010168_53320 [Actinoplanes ianthinogenes]
MSLPPLATVEALTVRLGGEALAGADLARARAALDDVSALVRLEAGVDWVAADAATITAPAAVVAVVLAAALRGYRNPDGFQSESVGSYSYQYAQGSTSAYLSDAEIRIVKAAATGRARAYSIRTPPAYEWPTQPRAPWEAP